MVDDGARPVNGRFVVIGLERFSGSYGNDGLDSIAALYANTRNNPIEDIESHVSLGVECYELREDAAAAGKSRGGAQIAFLADGAVSIESEGHKYPPKGFSRSSDGTPGN
jgi:N-methylhydantoinase B